MRTAQTLYSGIFEIGSWAEIVTRLMLRGVRPVVGDKGIGADRLGAALKPGFAISLARPPRSLGEFRAVTLAVGSRSASGTSRGVSVRKVGGRPVGV
jgi:hypothetical protein